jgi:ribosomal protein S18 acetylase RimI-like enzyme
VEGPRTHTHVGDLAWWVATQTGREREPKRRLWLDDGRCAAWAWLDRPASLDYEIRLDHRGGALHEEVIDWFEAEAEGEAPRVVWYMEGDDAAFALLSSRGYVASEKPGSYLYYVFDLDAVPPVPEVPTGFRLRTVRGDHDVRERVLVHRAVWAPSRVTEDVHRRVMRIWPYRRELDCVLEAPDGSFAAYVLCWYDDANRVGEFEPVGTHPDYRRLGFGSAVCRYALHRLREEGATQAVVYASGRDDQRHASALYESLGFRRHTRMLELRKAR